MHFQASLLSSASFGSDQHNLVLGGRSTDQEWTDTGEGNQEKKRGGEKKNKTKKHEWKTAMIFSTRKSFLLRKTWMTVMMKTSK